MIEILVLRSEHDAYHWILPKERKLYDIMDPEWEVIDRYANWQNKSIT